VRMLVFMVEDTEVRFSVFRTCSGAAEQNCQ
jgi:hypothetical protein